MRQYFGALSQTTGPINVLLHTMSSSSSLEGLCYINLFRYPSILCYNYMLIILIGLIVTYLLTACGTIIKTPREHRESGDAQIAV